MSIGMGTGDSIGAGDTDEDDRGRDGHTDNDEDRNEDVALDGDRSVTGTAMRNGDIPACPWSHPALGQEGGNGELRGVEGSTGNRDRLRGLRGVPGVVYWPSRHSSAPTWTGFSPSFLREVSAFNLYVNPPSVTPSAPSPHFSSSLRDVQLSPPSGDTPRPSGCCHPLPSETPQVEFPSKKNKENKEKIQIFFFFLSRKKNKDRRGFKDGGGRLINEAQVLLTSPLIN